MLCEDILHYGIHYLASLKLVLIPHSPWLLLVKIKCQLQNSWKIEL